MVGWERTSQLALGFTLGLLSSLIVSTRAESLVVFSGDSNSYAELKNQAISATDGNFAASIWVWPTTEARGEEQAILAVSSDHHSSIVIGWSDSTFYYDDAIKAEPLKAKEEYPEQQWHQLTLTYETVDLGEYYYHGGAAKPVHKRMTLYVNGKPVVVTTTKLPDLSQVDVLVAAQWLRGSVRNNFEGGVDELRFYTRSLGERDATGLAFVKANIASQPIAWYYNFEDSPGSPTISSASNMMVDGSNAALVNPKLKIYDALRDSITRMPYDAVSVTTHSMAPRVFDSDLRTDTGAPRLPILGDVPFQADGSFTPSSFLGAAMCRTTEPECDGQPGAVLDATTTTMKYNSPSVKNVSMSGTTYTLQVGNGGYNMANFTAIAEYNLALDFGYKLAAAFHFHASLMEQASGSDGLHKPDTVAKLEFGFDRNGQPGNALQLAQGHFARTQGRAWLGSRPEWTVCGWVKMQGPGILFYEQDRRLRHLANVLTVGERGQLYMDGRSLDATLHLGLWQFLCLQRSGSRVAAGVSGKMAAGTAMPMDADAANVTVSVLGHNASALLDDLFVWHRALPEAELQLAFKHTRSALEFRGTALRKEWLVKSSAAGLSFADISSVQPASAAFSFELWVRPQDAVTRYDLLHLPFSDGTGRMLQLGMSGGYVYFEVRNDPALSIAAQVRRVVTRNKVVQPKQWLHIVATYSSDAIRLYTNGQPQDLYTYSGFSTGCTTNGRTAGPDVPCPDASQGSTAGLTTPLQATQAAMIVGCDMACSRPFQGKIASLRIWKATVPAAKAASLYSCPPSYGDDALYAAFDLVEALGSKVLSSAKPRVYMEYQGVHLPLFVPMAASSLETGVGDFSWRKYTLAGDGTANGHSPRLGEAVKHVLQAADVCGHLITSGAQQVTFTLAPGGMVDGAVDSKSGGDGTYTAAYAIKKDAGYCGAAYQLLVGGPGGSNLSQHDMAVDAGPAVGHLSFVLKDTRGGQWNSLAKARALVDNGFLLFLVDQYGCQRRTTGPDKVEVALHGPGGYKYPGGVLPQSNGSYYLLYHPPTMGNFRVHVAVNGEPVGHAPAAMQTALEASAKQAYGPDVVVNNGGSPWCVSVLASKGAFVFAPPNYISTPSSNALNLPSIKWTISAWVWPAKQDDWPSGPGYGTGSIVGKMDSAKGYALGMEKWKLVGSVVTSDGKKLKAKSAAAVEAETWTHVAMAYDGYELTLLVNAEEAGAASMSRSAAVMDTEAPLQVGGGFVGMIDEVKVMPGHRQGMLHYQQYCPGAANDYLYLPFNEPPAEGKYSWDASGNFAAAQLGSAGGGPLPQYTTKQAPSKLGKLDLKHSVVDQPLMGYPNQPYDFSVALYDSCGMPYYSPVKQGVHVEFGLVKKQLTNEAHDIYEYPLELVEPVQVEMERDWDMCLGVVAWYGRATPDKCGPVRLEVQYGQVYGSLQSQGRIASLNVTSPGQTRLVKKHMHGYPRLARTYVIQAYDEAGCPRTSGSDTFLVQAARLSASDSQEMAREDLYFKTVPVRSMGVPGQYSFDFEPPSGGLYVLDISLVTPAGPVPIRDSGVVVDVSFPGWAMVDVKDQCDAGERYEPTVAVYDNWLYVLGGYDSEKQPALSVDPITQATILGYKYRLAERTGFLFQRLLKLSHMVDEVVRVTLDTQLLVGTGKMKEDCSDLLLVDRDDPSTVIPYWIDPGQPCGSASMGLWLAGNATEYILMLYGNEKYQFKDHLDPAQALYLYDGFEQSAASPLSTGWEVSGCHMEQVDEASFRLQGELANGGAAALMIDAKNYTGGSLSKKLVRPVKTFYARAWFYDTDIEPASNFISPNYEDCRGLPGNKHLLPRGYGLGVHTNSAPAHYSSLYPFRRSWVPRTAGWHLAEFYGSEAAIDIKMDGQLMETIPTSKDSPGGAHRVFIRGGGPGCGPATGLSVWDDIVVGFWDPKLSVTVGEEEVRLHDVAKCQPIAPAGFLPHRVSSASVLVGDKLYMAGDFEDGAVYTFSFRYQVGVGAGEVEGKVEKIAPFGMHAPSPRKGHALVEFEGSLFVVGGEQSDPSAAMELWEFNMKDQGWKLHRPIHAADSWPGARTGLVAAVFGGRLVVYGGDTVDGPSRQTWLYDFRGQVWAEVQHSAAPMHRVDAAAAVSNSSLYVFGGTNYLSNRVYGDAWRFSFDTHLWSPVAFNADADPGPRIKAGLATMTSYGDPALILYGGLGRQAYADLRILPIYDSTTAASH